MPGPMTRNAGLRRRSSGLRERVSSHPLAASGATHSNSGNWCRNQVNCRLAYCRVSARPNSAASSQRDLAPEMPDQRRHAMGLHRRQQRIELSRGESRDLVERAASQHRIEARVDPRIERVALRREEQRGERARRQQRRQAFAMPVGSARPVASITSSARAMRVRSRGFSRSAETGSRRASSACSASTPSRSSRARTASRISGGIGGTAESPRVSALK